jgi:hypothetical protein
MRFRVRRLAAGKSVWSLQADDELALVLVVDDAEELRERAAGLRGAVGDILEDKKKSEQSNYDRM